MEPSKQTDSNQPARWYIILNDNVLRRIAVCLGPQVLSCLRFPHSVQIFPVYHFMALGLIISHVGTLGSPRAHMACHLGPDLLNKRLVQAPYNNKKQKRAQAASCLRHYCVFNWILLGPRTSFAKAKMIQALPQLTIETTANSER